MARVTHTLFFYVWRKCVRNGLKVDVNKMKIKTLNVVFFKCFFKKTAQGLMSELHEGFVKNLGRVQIPIEYVFEKNRNLSILAKSTSQ